MEKYGIQLPNPPSSVTKKSIKASINLTDSVSMIKIEPNEKGMEIIEKSDDLNYHPNYPGYSKETSTAG